VSEFGPVGPGRLFHSFMSIRNGNTACIFPKELKGFAQIGMQPRLRTLVQARRRSFPLNISATLDIEGIAAVVFGTPTATGKNPVRWQLTVQHEIFHVFQAANHGHEKVQTLKLGPEDDASWQLNFPFPYSDPEVMRLIHLQGYPAYLAISSQSADDARYAAGTMMEAAQVYRTYLNRIDPDGRLYRYSEFRRMERRRGLVRRISDGKAGGTNQR